MELKTKAGEPVRMREVQVIDRHGVISTLWCIELQSPVHGRWMTVTECKEKSLAERALASWLE